MSAVVAHISDVEKPVVGGLILQIESPVLHVRQFVVDVIASKQKRSKEIARGPTSRKAAGGLGQVGQRREKPSAVTLRRRHRRRSERLGNSSSLRNGGRRNEGRRKRYAERAIEAGASAG